MLWIYTRQLKSWLYETQLKIIKDSVWAHWVISSSAFSFGLIFTLLMFWHGNQGQGKTCVVFIHEIQVSKSKKHTWIYGQFSWPLGVGGFVNGRLSDWQKSFYTAHVLARQSGFSYMNYRYSNLPNNCVGPFNCVSGRFIRN